MNDFILQANGAETGAWVLLTTGKVKYGPSAAHIRQLIAQGIKWGGYNVLVPSPLDRRLVADQSVWYLQYRNAIGDPDLPDLLHCEVDDPNGPDHLAVAAVEWMMNVEMHTHRECLVYASERTAGKLPGYPWGRKEWPGE